MKIVIIDGQGGRMGRSVIEQLKKSYPDLELYAIGTNSIATSAMIKAGASHAATGENPAIVNSQDADIIIGPIGIVIKNDDIINALPHLVAEVGDLDETPLLVERHGVAVGALHDQVAHLASPPAGETILQRWPRMIS